MPDDRQDDSNSQLLLQEVRQIHQEMTNMHRDVLHAMRYLAAIASGIRDIRGFEAKIASAPAQVPAHAAINTQRCHSCGATLSRHPAQAGVLLLCPTCGWSEFVEHDGHETAEVSPQTAPPGPQNRHWAV